MKGFITFALTAATTFFCFITNPMITQAAELTTKAVSEEIVVEIADPTLAFEDALFALINEERSKHGLTAYELDTTVDLASETRIGELEEIFSHNRDGGKRFSTVLVVLGVSYSSAAEIIAAGQTSPELVLSAWLNSPRHCRRILSSEYTSIGVAHIRAESGIDYWEVLFIN